MVCRRWGAVVVSIRQQMTGWADRVPLFLWLLIFALGFFGFFGVIFFFEVHIDCKF